MQDVLRNPLINPNEGLSITRTWPENPDLPLSLSEAKTYLKVDFDSEDSLISDLIEESVQEAETAYSIAIVPQTVVFTLSKWNKHVPFPITPFISLTSVTIDGTASTAYTLYGENSSKYLLMDAQGEGELKITYQAGWSALPADIKRHIRTMVANGYEYRDGSETLNREAMKRLAKYANMSYVV